MPTINQLPPATTLTGADVLPLSQNGLTRSVTVGTLLGGTQTALSVAQDSVLGRASPGVGGPEALRIGVGLMLSGTALAADGQDHLGLTQATSLQPTDEIIINNAAQPKRVPAATVRSLFSAGSGVTIDQTGVISVTTGTGGAGTQGPKGDTGAAGQGFSFRGQFQTSTAYSAYDVVVNGGQTYVAASAFVSGSTFDTTRWTLMAAQGLAGTAGTQGATGAQGPAGPIVPATTTSVGAVKPGGGLSVASDGTLSIGSVSLSTIAQGGATTGQVLGWTGTGWGPTAGGAAGVSTFNNRNGPVSLTIADVTSVVGSGASARSNLGLAAVASSGSYADLIGGPVIPPAASIAPLMDGAGTAGTAAAFARADHVHPSDASRLAASSNLSDLASPATARANLGLGGAATLNVGTAAGTLAAGNDARLTGALQPSAIPAASGQLLGGSGSNGAASVVTIGTGLSLTGGTLNATGGGSYALVPASMTTLGGVKPDGTTVAATPDGTLSVTGVSAGSLPDIASSGGPALSDIDVLSRGGADYKVTLSARASLFRKTPAGSRTVTLAAGAATVTLTAADHDKTVVVIGSTAGSLAVDGTITDGFRCQVINHCGSALAFSGIAGLQGATSLPNNASCWVSLSNATVEATSPTSASNASAGGSSGQLQINSNGAFGGINIGAGLTVSQGTLAASPSVASATNVGSVKPDGSSITVATDGTLSVPSVQVSSLIDIATLGGPALSDVDIVNRSGADYKTALSARAALFRKTPAGSRTVTLATGASNAILTATDHDKTLVVAGVVPGNLAVDGTIVDGFRCQVINHTGSPLAYSGITGLQSTSLPNNAACWVTLSNSTVEASMSTSSATGVTSFNSRTGAVGLMLSDVTSLLGSGPAAQTNLALGGAALLGVGTAAGTVAAGNDSRLLSALQSTAIPAATNQLLGGSGTAGVAVPISIGAGLSLSGSALSVTSSYTLPAATSATLGGVKQGSGVTIAADGTISASGGGGVSTFNSRGGAVTLSLGDLTAVSGTGASAQTSFGLGNAAVLNVGTAAGTVAAGNDSRLSNALQASAIPAAGGQLLGGSGAAGSASAISIGTGLLLSANTLSVSSSYALPVATTSMLGGVKQGGGVSVAADGTLSVPAYMTAGVVGVVGTLPGGGGATVYCYVFVRPCTFATNLATPYAPQAQAGTAASANASFTLIKRAAAGAQASFGALTLSPSGSVTALTNATSFAAGDELLVTSPNPADATLADVSLTFTGTWG